MEENFILYPCLFVIEVATHYAEKLLGLQHESVSVNCEPRPGDLTWTQIFLSASSISAPGSKSEA